MIELSIGDLHRITALATALNASEDHTIEVPLQVGPDTNRRTVWATGIGVRIDPEDTLPDREPPLETPPAE